MATGDDRVRIVRIDRGRKIGLGQKCVRVGNGNASLSPVVVVDGGRVKK